MEKRGPERIRQLATAALEGRKEDPRFILASAAADVPWDTPEGNIDAVRAAVEAYAAGGAPS
jgi:hypothetical protein